MSEALGFGKIRIYTDLKLHTKNTIGFGRIQIYNVLKHTVLPVSCSCCFGRIQIYTVNFSAKEERNAARGDQSIYQLASIDKWSSASIYDTVLEESDSTFGLRKPAGIPGHLSPGCKQDDSKSHQPFPRDFSTPITQFSSSSVWISLSESRYSDRIMLSLSISTHGVDTSVLRPLNNRMSPFCM